MPITASSADPVPRFGRHDPGARRRRPLALLDRALPRLFGGLGRHPGLHELYGLTVPEGGPEPYMREKWRGGIYKRNTGPASTRAETEHITKGKANA